MKEVTRTLKEFVALSVIGLLFGLVANGLNSHGLSLTRNYFQHIPPPPPTASQPALPTTTTQAGTAPTDEDDNPISKRLRDSGVGLITGPEVQALIDDPGYQSGLYVVVDARNDEHYNEGHIPGAYQLDHYQGEKYIGPVLPQVLTAQKVVVYCTGGKICDDSEYVAGDLIQQGVDRSQIFVYMGGMDEWLKDKRLIEKGQRGSGDITEGKQ